MKTPRRTYPTMIDRMAKSLVWIFSVTAFIPFFILLWKVTVNGWKEFTPDLIMQFSPTGNDNFLTQIGQLSVSYGILNGIYGTIFIIVIAIVPAVLLGLLTGIYIFDHRTDRFASIVRQVNNVLQGAPAIIVGLTVYWWVVQPGNHFSALAGSLSLFTMLLPAITGVTVRILEQSSIALRDSGFALGGSYCDVTCKIVLPAAGKHLAAAIVSIITRIMGQTAPFIVTAAGIDRMNLNIAGPANTLTVLIWNLFNNPAFTHLMWSAALFCIVLIIILHWITHLIYPLYDESAYT